MRKFENWNVKGITIYIIGIILLLAIIYIGYSYIIEKDSNDIANKEIKNEYLFSKDSSYMDGVPFEDLNIPVIDGYTYDEIYTITSIHISIPRVHNKYTEINQYINSIKFLYDFKNDENKTNIRNELLKRYEDATNYGYGISYTTYKNGNSVTIQLNESRGIDSSSFGDLRRHYVNYDDNTGKLIYLDDYLTSINKTLAQADSLYKANISALKDDGDSVENPIHYSCTYKPLTDKTDYYVENNKLYIIDDNCTYTAVGEGFTDNYSVPIEFK